MSIDFASKYRYHGDVNLSYGGIFVNVDNFPTVDVVEIADLSNAVSFDLVYPYDVIVEIRSGTVDVDVNEIRRVIADSMPDLNLDLLPIDERYEILAREYVSHYGVHDDYPIIVFEEMDPDDHAPSMPPMLNYTPWLHMTQIAVKDLESWITGDDCHYLDDMER